MRGERGAEYKSECRETRVIPLDSRIEEREKSRYARTNVRGPARFRRRDEICREGGGGAEKRSRSGALHLYMPHAVESPHKIRQIVRFLVDSQSSQITMGRRKRVVQQGEAFNYVCHAW